MNKDKGVMRNVETRNSTEKMDEIACRQLYNKIVAKLNDSKFKTTEKDKQLLQQLRFCEKYLREMDYYSQLIYDRQAKEGNAIQEEHDRNEAREPQTQNED